jgi:hypothetical protein
MSAETSTRLMPTLPAGGLLVRRAGLGLAALCGRGARRRPKADLFGQPCRIVGKAGQVKDLGAGGRRQQEQDHEQPPRHPRETLPLRDPPPPGRDGCRATRQRLRTSRTRPET